MSKLSNGSKVAISIIIAVIAVVLIVYYGESSTHNGSPASTSQATSTVTAGTSMPGPTATGTTTTAKPVTPAEPAQKFIALLAPVPGITWKIGTLNTIAWAKEANVTGEIELLNYPAGSLMGVILSQVGPYQTSYPWNTRDLYVSRTNPSEITVTPGRYTIKMVFDGNDITPVVSQPFTLSQ